MCAIRSSLTVCSKATAVTAALIYLQARAVQAADSSAGLAKVQEQMVAMLLQQQQQFQQLSAQQHVLQEKLYEAQSQLQAMSARVSVLEQHVASASSAPSSSTTNINHAPSLSMDAAKELHELKQMTASIVQYVSSLQLGVLSAAAGASGYSFGPMAGPGGQPSAQTFHAPNFQAPMSLHHGPSPLQNQQLSSTVQSQPLAMNMAAQAAVAQFLHHQGQQAPLSSLHEQRPAVQGHASTARQRGTSHLSTQSDYGKPTLPPISGTIAIARGQGINQGQGRSRNPNSSFPTRKPHVGGFYGGAVQEVQRSGHQGAGPGH